MQAFDLCIRLFFFWRKH